MGLVMVGKQSFVVSPMAAILSSLLLGTFSLGTSALAVDHFVTIGGGYAPDGNQASMEANVQFFQELLENRYQPGEFKHHIFFSDGRDPDSDVQAAPSEDLLSESQKMIADLFDWETQPIIYRDHQVSAVSGSNRAGDVRRGIENVASELADGDRMFLYVTAHGGKSKNDKNAFETSVYGWQQQSFRSSDLARWLDKVPENVPVIMVMAQCYCGGFSHSIFEDADAEKPIAKGLRCGFFAQRHDLPAAGCRPDISNDREYSSYFWGAFAGQSRNGNRIEGVDRDGDGKVSLAEAHIYAVVASETIDIPLRSSEALLRVHSKLATDDLASDETEAVHLAELSGPLSALLAEADSIDASIAGSLAQELGFGMNSTVEEVQDRLADARPRRRGRGRMSMRGYRDSEGRLKDEILTRWPEIEKIESLGECTEMGVSLEEIESEILAWDSFQNFQSMVQSRNQQRESSQQAELRQVKLKRLMHTLETVVLAKNLQHLAKPEIIQRYQDMLALERATL